MPLLPIILAVSAAVLVLVLLFAMLAGDYNGEPITYELFYERLKFVMGETEDC